MPSDEALLQQLLCAAMDGTGATSACVFEKTANNTLRAVAVAGLFPPQRTLGNPGTRAKLIEQALKPVEFPIADGIVGRVAKTGVGELLADASSDSREVKQPDPSLVMRSVIAVPLTRGGLTWVLALANPADSEPFTPDHLRQVQALAGKG